MQRIAIVWVLCVSSVVARADSKAWTAAKKVLPANLAVVVGVNAAPLRASDLYKELLPLVAAKAGDVQAKLDEIKATCSIDPTQAADSVVVGVDDGGKGAIVVAMKGVGQKEIEGCLGKVAKAHSKALAISKEGALVRYHLDGEAKDLYLRWLGKDTFAIATQPDDKDATNALTGGGLSGDKVMGATLAQTKTGATMWMALNKQQDLDQFHTKMTGLYGSADLKSGQVNVDVHVIVDSAAAAGDIAKQTTAMVPMLASSGKVPPSMSALVKSLVIKSIGKEVVASAHASEKDIIAIVQTFLPH